MSQLAQTYPVTKASAGLGFFERYLSIWVALCMLVGIGLGRLLPSVTNGLRGLELGKGSQVNLPMAILIWLMITPMMMKVDFGAVRNVGKRPGGLFVTLFINWIVKPFSMAFLTWLFFRHLFAGLVSPAMQINTSLAASSSLLPPARPWCLCGVISRTATLPIPLSRSQ
jgi:ACR3 family arsenite transporter